MKIAVPARCQPVLAFCALGLHTQGSKKVSSSCLGQEDFPSHLSNGQGIRHASPLASKALKDQTKTCPQQAEFESFLSQG